MTTTKLLRLLAVPLLALAILASPTGAAAAAPIKPSPTPSPGHKVVMVDGAGYVTTADDTGVSKAQWLTKYGMSSQPPSGMNASGSCSYVNSDGYASGPAGPDSFYTYGWSCVSTDCLFTCSSYFSENESHAYWLGYDPPYATTIDASMQWWISGWNVTASVPAGFGFSSVNGSDVVWRPGGVSPAWVVDLYYQAAININAWDIFNAYFTDQADILLGHSWFHVQGN